MKILRDAKGATAVEFALIAPVLFLLLTGIIEAGLILFSQSALEGAAASAARTGKTGYVNAAANLDRTATIRAELARHGFGLIDPARAVIASSAYSNFADIGRPEPFTDRNGNGVRDVGENYTDTNGNGRYDADMGAAGAGNSGQVVVYTITYPWRMAMPQLAEILGISGELPLSARLVVKNEPYER